MEENIASPAFEPHWVPSGSTTRSPGRILPSAARASLFLQRDLNEEALRQPVEPVFSQAELAAVRQEGFDAGHAAGMAAAAASREAARTASEIQALATIAATLADARRTAARVADQAADALARTVLAAMDSVMPDLIRRSALNEVGAMLAHVLPGLSREPAVRIEVPADIAGSITASLASLAPELRDRITVDGVNRMRPGDAEVHWGAGHATRQPAEVWQAVMAALHAELSTTEITEPKTSHPGLQHPERSPSGAKDSNNGE
jgi:flagellar biosynthesis/type III secretory pathway protein FliH